MLDWLPHIFVLMGAVYLAWRGARHWIKPQSSASACGGCEGCGRSGSGSVGPSDSVGSSSQTVSLTISGR